jgi:hypothetical protein
MVTFSCTSREEEAAILNPPIQKELEGLLIEMGADRIEAAVSAQLQNAFGSEWKGSYMYVCAWHACMYVCM